MSSSSSRRPPGLRSNNIDIDFDRAERLLSEAQDSEVLHTMELGMVDIGDTVSVSDDDSMPGLEDCSDDESSNSLIRTLISATSSLMNRNLLRRFTSVPTLPFQMRAYRHLHVGQLLRTAMTAMMTTKICHLSSRSVTTMKIS